MTWRELLAEATERLKEAGIAECETDAWILFSEVFDMSRARYFLCRDQKVSVGEPGEKEGAAEGKGLTEGTSDWENARKMEQFREFVARRCSHIPLQQITGHQEFMGLDFLVNEHVLCPRQDTEVLVETVLNELAEICAAGRDDLPADSIGVSLPDERTAAAEGKTVGELHGGCKMVRILDMCAGSGCIGISLERLAAVPVEVLAADISDGAIAVAKTNAEKLGCEHYRIIESNLFAQIEGSFDVIVSNPPYIPSAVIETLDEEVQLHEPRLALDGEADGLAFYRKISEEAAKRLTPGGKIYYEIGYDQGAAVSDILAAHGFVDIRIIKDLAGLDRVAAARNRWR